MAALALTAGMAEKYAQRVLGDTALFFEFASIITKAGEAAALNPSVLSATNDVSILPLHMEGCTRKKAPIGVKLDSVVPVVNFDARSITIVGGSAIQAYTTINGRNENYVQTTDIDAVWWPKILLPGSIKQQMTSKGTIVDASIGKYLSYIYQSLVPKPNSEKPNIIEPFIFSNKDEDKMKYISADNFAVLSSSWAIQSLVQQYTKELEKQLKRIIGYKDIKTKLIQYAKDVYDIEDPIISSATKYNNQFVAGSCNIWGYLLVHNGSSYVATVKLIEMTIHDGASSQKSTQLEPAMNDISFMRFDSLHHKTVPEPITYYGKVIYVPSVQRLMDQQLFVLGTRSGDKKKTTLHRIKFLYKYLKDDPVYTTIINDLCTKGSAILCQSPDNKTSMTALAAMGAPGYAATPYMPSSQSMAAMGAPGHAATPYMPSSQSMAAMGAPGHAATPYMPSSQSMAAMGAPGYAATPNMPSSQSMAAMGAPGYAATPNMPSSQSMAAMGAPGYAATPYMPPSHYEIKTRNKRNAGKGRYNNTRRKGTFLLWMAQSPDGKYDIYHEMNKYGEILQVIKQPRFGYKGRHNRKTRKL